MHDTPESYAITLQLSRAQVEWLEHAARAYGEVLGRPVAHGPLMMRMLELGLPKLEAELHELSGRRANTGRRLQLVRAE